MQKIDNCRGESVKYLKVLSKQYPNIQSVCTEIINLQAILNLPKGTEHFLSDIHGEYEAFLHILKNASGVIKNKIDDMFGNSMSVEERKTLATVIYYPEQKLEIIKKQEDNIEEWYKATLYRLIELCRAVASKYTRSKVRKALPREYEYIIDELLNAKTNIANKEIYYRQIIDTIIRLDRADAFITAISEVVQTLSVDHMHIVGDIFDRGPGPHIIMEALIKHHSVFVQWGNHDIVWMGAAAGNEACIANVLRMCARYNNLDILEEGYGINIRPIATFAMDIYKDDNSQTFAVKNPNNRNNIRDIYTMAKIHKAISIIQFKVEGQLIKRHPEYGMDDRLSLEHINYKKGTIMVDGQEYALNDTFFPTIDPKDPYKLTDDEQDIMDRLKLCFLQSEKLQRHANFLFAKGSMYTSFNSNLMIHGCIPMTKDGDFQEVNIKGKMLKGKEYVDYAEQIARKAYFAEDNSEEKEEGLAFMWYLWCGPYSPLFGKHAMKTFERYFLDDEKPWKEKKDPYYKNTEKKEMCEKVLAEFCLNPEKSHIISGHIPVKLKDGESPIKAEGKLLVIDGGFSKTYQPRTGIAGYTLIYNSYGLVLTAHQPFESTEKAIKEEKDILSTKFVVEEVEKRILVADTDIGKDIKEQVHDLEALLEAYRQGLIKEM